MRNLPILSLLIIFSSFSNNYNSAVLPHGSFEIVNKSSEKIPITAEKIASMKMKEAEKILGRKLTFKEKLSFKLAQFKIKKEIKAKEKGKSSKGQTAFILSLIGLGILFIPYLAIASIPLAIIAIVQGSKAKKEVPHDGKAQAAVIIGIVTLGLIAIAIIVAIAWLSAWAIY